MNLKDKRLPFIVGGVAIVVILLLIKFMPGQQAGDGPEVISKRVKIEVPTDGSAQIDSTAEGAPSAEPQAMPAQMEAPPVTPAPGVPMQIKPAPAPQKAVEAAPAVAPQPVQKHVAEPVKAPAAVEKKAPAPKAVAKAEVKKTAEKAKKTTVAKKSVPAGKAWVLNLASFPSLSEAQALAGRLKKGGYNAYIAKFTKNSVQWHRVRVGFYASRDEAVKTGKTIKRKFNLDEPWVTRPEKAELSHM